MSSTAFFASCLVTCVCRWSLACASLNRTSPSNCRAEMGMLLTPSPVALALILR